MPSSTFVRRKRLNFAINREMQVRMVWRIGLTVFASLLLSTAIYYFFANREVTDSFQMFHIRARNFLDFLLPVVIASFAVSLVLGVGTALFIPRYIAGSLYRIEEDIKKIREGNLSVRISLRLGDEAGSLAASVNTMVNDFRETFSVIQEGLDEANRITKSGEPAEDKLAKLDGVNRRLMQKVAHYRTEP